ncbi:36027_t:CDS:2, partial [Racocetra persica]
KLNDRQLKIKDAFFKADEMIPTLPTTSLQYRDRRYTPQVIEPVEDARSSLNRFIESYT